MTSTLEKLVDHVAVVEKHTDGPVAVHEVPTTVILLPGRPLWSTTNPSWSIWRPEDGDTAEERKAKRDRLSKWRVSRTDSVQVILVAMRTDRFDFMVTTHSTYFYNMGYAPTEEDKAAGIWVDELLSTEAGVQKRICVFRDLIRYASKETQAEYVFLH